MWIKYAKTEPHLRQLYDPSETNLASEGAGSVKERTPRGIQKSPGGLGYGCTPSLHSQPLKMPHYQHASVKTENELLISEGN